MFLCFIAHRGSFIYLEAKYKLWQESLRSDGGNATITSTVKQASQEGNTAVTPPKRAPKLLVPKQMPVQSTSTGPATPFSARKKLTRERESPISPPSEQPSHPNPFSQSRGKQHGTVVVPVRSASKPTASSQSSRIIPFDSSSSARHRTFPAFPPNLLNSDSDDDDNPFAAPDPISPTRSRRASQLITPSKSALRHQGSSAVSTPSSIMKKCSTNLELSPTRPKHLSGTALPMMTPRTKARKRMRGEEVPATPGDKRRKLGLATTDKALVVFGESSGRGMKRLTPEDEDDEDDEEIVNSPKKKSALAANGRVFTNMFDETSSAAASTRDGMVFLIYVEYHSHILTLRLKMKRVFGVLHLRHLRKAETAMLRNGMLMTLRMRSHPPPSIPTPAANLSFLSLPENGLKTPGMHPRLGLTCHICGKD
jgi:hypothetical protein